MIEKLYILLALLTGLSACSGDKPYNESADAKADIKHALIEAKAENLPVILIFGANWCEECRALNATIKTGKNAAQITKEFKVVKVDVGNFDHNLDIAKSYGNPIAGGIPGATVLSPDNTVIYITKRGELSAARSQGEDGIYNFLNQVSKKIKPST
ncbi:MAG: thioredoxin family protein [Pseudomonadota bacterium]